jgi:putative transposase
LPTASVRGLRDILIACCDGLTGLPEAITSVFPDTVVVHVMRSAMRCVSYQDRKKIAVSIGTIYVEPTVGQVAAQQKDVGLRHAAGDVVEGPT